MVPHPTTLAGPTHDPACPDQVLAESIIEQNHKIETAIVKQWTLEFHNTSEALNAWCPQGWSTQREEIAEHADICAKLLGNPSYMPIGPMVTIAQAGSSQIKALHTACGAVLHANVLKSVSVAIAFACDTVTVTYAVYQLQHAIAPGTNLKKRQSFCRALREAVAAKRANMPANIETALQKAEQKAEAQPVPSAR